MMFWDYLIDGVGQGLVIAIFAIVVIFVGHLANKIITKIFRRIDSK